MEGIGSYKSGLDILEATELRLGLPGTNDPLQRTSTRVNKRALDATISNLVCVADQGIGTEAKVRVVGWPPVRHHCKNSFQGRKKEDADESGNYVKVSMDGAPYLRKIALKAYKGYTDHREALQDLFKCFSLGSEYVITYEDEDGDWMLVGDVPWGMFISSCKRLRITRESESRGLDSNQ